MHFGAGLPVPLQGAATGCCRMRVGYYKINLFCHLGSMLAYFFYMESWAIDLQHFLNPTYGYCTNLIITTVMLTQHMIGIFLS